MRFLPIGLRKSDPSARINCGDSSFVQWPPESIDGVFTDPPYYGNVQYADPVLPL
jgi:DNA modification methylase